MAETVNFGTFEKDGETRVADAPDEAVRLRYEGWAQTVPSTGEAKAAEVEAREAEKAAAKAEAEKPAAVSEPAPTPARRS